MEATNSVFDSLRSTWDQVAQVAPAILIAVLVLIAGWLIARVSRRLAIRLFRRLHLDTLAERVGIEGFLMQGGVEFTTVTLLGGLIYWAVLLVTLIVLMNLLAVPAGAELVERIVRFLPNVMAAVIVLIFGSVVARFVGTVAFTYLNNVGSRGATAIAAVARFAVLGFVIAMAVEQLALRSEILVSGFQIAFGALCLALALAFGLGGREWAARILDKHWKV